jgi:hypothetical protein
MEIAQYYLQNVQWILHSTSHGLLNWLLNNINRLFHGYFWVLSTEYLLYVYCAILSQTIQ